MNITIMQAWLYRIKASELRRDKKPLSGGAEISGSEL
jgi:hypothetical protein